MKKNNKIINIYSKSSLYIVNKLLTNLDRDKHSPTYGSFDRNHWHYKIRDFSSSILQQSSLSLALVYANNFQGNKYFNNEKVKELAIAGIIYWTKIQHNNGSFSEYWHNEKSIPATAFTLSAICETCTILKIKNKKVFKCIRKATNFLIKNCEDGALNQEMTSITAIAHSGELLSDELIKIKAQKKFDSLLSKQDSEGWFSEYCGVDIGYLTVTLDYLIRYFNITNNKKAITSATNIIEFIKYFVHPDNTIGGEYGTRNTEYFLPYGFEFMQRFNPIAGRIIKKIMTNINNNNSNLCFDERYYLHYVSHSFIKSAIIYTNQHSKVLLPFETSFEKYFSNGMIFIKSTEHYYLIYSLMKSGVFKIMGKDGLNYHNDVCYRIKYKNDVFTSEWPNKNQTQIKNGKVSVKSKFLKKSFFVQTPLKQTLLKIVSYFFGKKMIRIAKKRMIYDGGSSEGFHFQRSITLYESSISVEDIINVGNKSVKAYKINELCMRHSASSRLFQFNSLNNKTIPKSYLVSGVIRINERINY